MARLRGHSGLTDRGLERGASAPSGAAIGQMWFNTGTGVLYQRTANVDGSSFWLDISSGGIGTSVSEGVDFVGDIDPHKATNGTGLAIGSVYYNRENNRHFVCTDATTNANVWSGRYSGLGGTVTDYLLSSTYYKVHSFLSSGSFFVQAAITCDILIVGGGGGGGAYSGGGGGAGGVRQLTGQSLSYGTYTVTVGDGGFGTEVDNTALDPRLFGNGQGIITQGGDSSVIGGSYSEIGSGGGWGGSFNAWSNATDWRGSAGGSGGGGGRCDASATYAGFAGDTPNKTPDQGFGGGSGQHSSGSFVHAGGGGGAGGAGGNGSNGTGGNAGIGITNTIRDGVSGTTVAVHRFGGGGAGDGNAGNGTSQAAYGGGAAGAGIGGAGVANSGGGGGGGHYANGFHGGRGGSGIVVIRYPLN